MFRKLIMGISLIAFFFALGACGGSSGGSSGGGDLALGEEVYAKYCVLCHGDDGKKEFNGAKDITVSQLTRKEKETLIREGKNLMTPFNGILSDDEIAAVAAYTESL